MKSFLFRHVDGTPTTVQAASEADGRHLAMVSKWGPPSGMYGPRYKGQGLELVEVGSST